MLLFTRALLVAVVLSGAGCSVYDSIPPYSNASVDSSVATDACAPETEICNRKDDDCDGRVDEAEAVALDCAAKLLNVPSTCVSGYCVKAAQFCNDGFYNCDGMPDNGCEAACPCSGCEEDAGPEAG